MAKKASKTSVNNQPVKFGQQYYKVVRSDGTGGHSSFKYKNYLPVNGKPGKALTIPYNKNLFMCSTGFHVTTNPNQWGGDQRGSRVFEVKVFGEYKKDGSDKICCRKIQLTREVVEKNGKWVPKAPEKTYTKAEVTKIVTNLKQKYDTLFQTALNQLQ